MRTDLARFALVLSALAGWLGCGGDDGGDGPAVTGSLDASLAQPDAGPALEPGMMAVSLRFKATIGSEELVCGQRYAALGSTRIAGKAQDFRLFVHDVRLIGADGAEVPVRLDDRKRDDGTSFQSRELALLDFTDGRGSCTSGAPASNMVVHGQVPIGRYTGIAFTTGVPEALNHADPASAPAPLQQPGVAWNWRQGYRFVLAELNVDEGIAALDAGISDGGISGPVGHGGIVAQPGLVIAHFGSEGCVGAIGSYRCASPNRSAIRLTGFDPTQNTVIADLGALVAGADLTKAVQCHGFGDACAPMFVALGLDLASGAPLPAQQVFRVE